ncbi:MAG: CDP-diacylglycerol--glycerol-3-phosphate 3-phosphatidyltransferase [Candidatus Thermoplasmatota archaeon]|nr:CDP-diacylglycerol--glycerol-3-phosphate 3-phosphatidyltransferase [Candidatus Thermoplasmatota archaeon]
MNLPNKLSLLRIFLVPAFLAILYMEGLGDHNFLGPHNAVLATLVFIIASATDMLDGYIARSRGLITDLGKFLDPLADKMLVVSAFVYLVGVGRIPDWMVITIIIREFAVSGLRILAASQKVVISASSIGKLKTQSQMVAIVLALLQWPNVVFLGFQFYWWVALVAVVLTVVSGADYIWKGRKHIKEK